MVSHMGGMETSVKAFDLSIKEDLMDVFVLYCGETLRCAFSCDVGVFGAGKLQSFKDLSSLVFESAIIP